MPSFFSSSSGAPQRRVAGELVTGRHTRPAPYGPLEFHSTKLLSSPTKSRCHTDSRWKPVSHRNPAWALPGRLATSRGSKPGACASGSDGYFLALVPYLLRDLF